MTDVIPFDEIVSGATIRVTVIDGKRYLSVRDMIMCFCEKNQNDAGEVWRNLSPDKKIEVQESVLNYKFPGRGQQDQPVITFPGAVKLAMFLPGENAKKNRSAMAQILVRYCAGDPSLIQEIEANARSDEPVAQMARESLEPNWKRKAEELDLRERLSKVKDAEIARINVFASTMDILNPEWKKDTRFRLRVEDLLKNTLLDEIPAITDGTPSTQSVSVGEVAQKMGVQLKKHGDSIAIGKAVAKAYFQQYGKPPPKHRQWVDGAEREINSYTEADRGLIEKAIRTRMMG